MSARTKWSTELGEKKGGKKKGEKEPTSGQTGGGGEGKFSVFMNTVAGRIILRRWI